MARLSTAILNANPSDASSAYGKDHQQPMLDLRFGGQQGWAPNLVEWVSNQAYVRRDLICILLEAPAFFQLMPSPEKWIQTLKSLVEIHPKTIDGYKAGLEVTVEEHNVVGAGEFQQEYTDVKRARSEPVFTFMEKYGMPIQTFLSSWITYGMMDPDTKYAMVGTLDGTNNSQPPSDLLADWYSMSCLMIEPDPTHRRVVKSWVTTNMFPKGTGEIIGKRDIASAKEMLELSIEFTGISQFNLGTNLMAQQILDQINISNANPLLRPSFITDIQSDVASQKNGYEAGVEDLGYQATTYTNNQLVPPNADALVNISRARPSTMYSPPVAPAGQPNSSVIVR